MEKEKSESIKELVEGIEKGNVSLPEFQRDFVWELEKTYDLFDSLVKQIFIGAIIYGKPSFEIAIREIDTLPRSSKGKGKRRQLKTEVISAEIIKAKGEIEGYRIILDGQQRSTSIYRALKGFDDVWFIAKNDSDYADVENGEMILDKDLSKRTLEEVLLEFSNEQSKDRISVKVSDAFASMQQNMREKEQEKIFFKKQIFQGFDETDYDNAFEQYLTIVKKLQDMFKESKLLSYYLLDMSMEKFTLFFERSNSKGISLRFADILAAKLYVGKFNLRDKIKEFEENNSELKDYFNAETIIRTIAYVKSDGKSKIDQSYILKDLTSKEFHEHWDNICHHYKQVLNFLRDNYFIISQSWMPYETMLVPLIIFSKELGKDLSQMNEKQAKYIRYWYWSSIFSQRYTGATNEAIVKDGNYMRLVAKGQKIDDRSFFNRLEKLQITKPDDFFDFSKRSSAIYKGVLNLIHFHASGLVGWDNPNKLNFNDNKLEDHHIFPQNYIKKKYADNQEALDKAESVVNRTLIPKITNIKISDKAPSVYLLSLKEKNAELENCLAKHLIPEPQTLLEGTFDEFYDVFFKERAKLLYFVFTETVTILQKEIFELFYQEKEFLKTGNVKVFGSFRSKTAEATLNLNTKKILYKGEEYSPSGAGKKFKDEVNGKDNNEANGWEFWKYETTDGGERPIKDYQ